MTAREDFWYQGAANFALRVAAHIMQKGLPKDTFLNINVPNVEEDEMRSYKITHQGKRVFEDAVVEKIDPRDNKYYWIRGGDQRF